MSATPRENALENLLEAERAKLEEYRALYKRAAEDRRVLGGAIHVVLRRRGEFLDAVSAEILRGAVEKVPGCSF